MSVNESSENEATPSKTEASDIKQTTEEPFPQFVLHAQGGGGRDVRQLTAKGRDYVPFTSRSGTPSDEYKWTYIGREKTDDTPWSDIVARDLRQIGDEYRLERDVNKHNVDDLIYHLASTQTSPENFLLFLTVKVLLDLPVRKLSRYLIELWIRFKTRNEEKTEQEIIPEADNAPIVVDGIQVHWVFLTDIPQELALQDDEAVISCGIRFSPSGAKLSKPIKVTLDHSAHFSNPRCAEIIFYTRNEDSKPYVRIPASTSGYPRCAVRAKDLDFYVDHFCYWWIVAVRNRNFLGKWVSCMPYLQRPVRKESTHFVLLYICRDNRRVRQKIQKEMEGYIELRPPLPIFVKKTYGDFNIKLFDGPRGNETEIDNKTLKEKDLNLDKRTRFSFQVKPLESGASEKILKFTLNQIKSLSDPTLIQFSLPYDATKTAAATTFPPMYVGLQAAAAATFSPMHDSSQAAGVSTPSQIDLESDGILNTLSKHIPPRTYAMLCTHLGIGYDEANGILAKFNLDYQRATRDCLAQWKTRTGGNMAQLKEILQNADVGNLAKYIPVE